MLTVVGGQLYRPCSSFVVSSFHFHCQDNNNFIYLQRMRSAGSDKTKHQNTLKEFHSAPVLLTWRWRVLLQGSSLYQSPSQMQARGPWRLSAEIVYVKASPERRAACSLYLWCCIIHPFDFLRTNREVKVRKWCACIFYSHGSWMHVH